MINAKIKSGNCTWNITRKFDHTSTCTNKTSTHFEYNVKRSEENQEIINMKVQ